MSRTSCLNSSLAVVSGLARADFDQHADLRAGVDVSGDESVAGNFDARVTGDLDVLANLRHDGDAVGFDVRVRIRRKFLCDVVAESAEAVVLRDKIRLAIDLHQHADFGAGRDVLGDDAFVRRAIRFFRGGRDAFFAQIFHGGFDVAFGLDERLFAIHQARAGHFAELADACSSDFSHNIKS